MGGVGLALLAGMLSTLSPCVLPLIPIVIGAAIGEHRFGPAALAASSGCSWQRSASPPGSIRTSSAQWPPCC
jgi:cytochrome c-type biogenesis protein